jgi:hypothetical protein
MSAAQTEYRATKSLWDMTPAERDEVAASGAAAVKQAMADKVAELRRPISFKGCGHWQKVVMTVVQHDAGPNSITVSHDGKIEGAWRLPLTYTKSSKAGQPIVRVLQTITPFQRMPLELGFLLIEVPGWIAGDQKRPLCQARSPTLSTDVEWSDSQREAWERLRTAFFRRRDAGEKASKKSYRQSRYDAERAARNAAGYFTVSELASGRSRL